ncbi:hypothetical protein CSB45_03875 [candidate division KSB3 bacterium]|uniref:Methyl-accepting transducer domain-containing protein n=1 Tax=candidate division KSB3 bacterium TaxID=2044937 RepID=A0A2G6E819_9BACT|nr:MAG: hypothetical protein CSB45_03875 [candidate division KSB3 bacterium]PIE30519.1 MAG: hypothetical protein CSA57_02460 [candidate division KSB3 bacterium]
MMKSSRRLMLILSALSIVPLLFATAIFGISFWLGAPSKTLLEILNIPILSILLLLALVGCIAFASSLSRRIHEQLTFLSRLGEFMGKGTLPSDFREQQLYEELRPLYQHLINHATFHEDINVYLKNLLEGSPCSAMELHSNDADCSHALNAFISRFCDIQQVLQAIGERNLALLEEMDEKTLGTLLSPHDLITELRNLSSEAQFYIEKLLRAASQIGSISNQSSQDTVSVSRRVNEILEATLKMTNTMQTLTASAHDQSAPREEHEHAHTVQEITNAVKRITSELGELDDLLTKHPAALEMPGNIHSSLERIHNTNTRIRTDAERSSQLTQKATKLVCAGQTMMEQTVTGLRATKESLNDFFEIVGSVGERSEEISEILKTIADVADHTNLLAINAAIIAAHAGEHGRDFAGIADEIGNVAERTKASVDELESLLQHIRADFQGAAQAMNSSSEAISEGLNCSLQARKALETIASNFHDGTNIALKLADSVVQHTQEYDDLRQVVTEQDDFNSMRQDEFSHILSHLLRLVGRIRDISAVQAEVEIQLSERNARFERFKKEIGHTAEQHIITGQQLLEATGYVQKLTQRTTFGIEKAIQLSKELVTLGGHLAFTVGEFPLSGPHRSAFQVDMPCIGVVKRNADDFFNIMLQSVKSEAIRHGLDVIELDSNNEATRQVENVNILLKQPFIQGVILCPTDINAAKKLVQKGSAQGIAFVAADGTIATTLSAQSNNLEGGQNAAKLFMRHLQPNTLIAIFTERSIESMTTRTLGFQQKAEQYPFDLIEIYCDMSSSESLRNSLKTALEETSGLQGIFLTNEELTCAYLDLLHEGQLSDHSFLAVGYDRTPVIEQAILDGEMLGAITQQPDKIGRQAFNLLYKLINKQIQLDDIEERTIYLATKIISKETLSA